jgi:hypothetical protein
MFAKRSWRGAGCGLLAIAASQVHAANVPYPYIDVISPPSTIVVNDNGTTLTMSGTAAASVSSLGVQDPLSPQGTFSLTGTYDGALSNPAANQYDFTSGSLSINNGTNLLTATFTDLELISASAGTIDYAIGSSALTYTGGSLAGALGSGEIVGTFTLAQVTALNGNGVADLSQAFSGESLTAKVGAVVPLPGTFGLAVAGIGLLGMLGRGGLRPLA